MPEADLEWANLQGAKLQDAIINKKTIMPPNWENDVQKDKNGETGVIFVED